MPIVCHINLAYTRKYNETGIGGGLWIFSHWEKIKLSIGYILS